MRNHSFQAAGLLLVLLGATQCGKSDLNSSDKRSGQDSNARGQISGSDSGNSTQQSGPASGVGTGNTDAEAISRCLGIWKNHPFDNNVYSDFKKINASVNVLGIGNSIKDTEATSGPKLIVVDAAVAVLSNTKYVLMNPNGWYCLKVGVNVHSNIVVDLQCQAKLAESKVGVNVGSSASEVAGVGVNVFSDVTLNRKADAQSDAGCP